MHQFANLFHRIWSIIHIYTETIIIACHHNFKSSISYHDRISKSITEPKSGISKLQSESFGFCVIESLNQMDLYWIKVHFIMIKFHQFCCTGYKLYLIYNRFKIKIQTGIRSDMKEQIFSRWRRKFRCKAILVQRYFTNKHPASQWE